jgi:hypothetical protein
LAGVYYWLELPRSSSVTCCTTHAPEALCDAALLEDNYLLNTSSYSTMKVSLTRLSCLRNSDAPASGLCGCGRKSTSFVCPQMDGVYLRSTNGGLSATVDRRTFTLPNGTRQCLHAISLADTKRGLDKDKHRRGALIPSEQ